MQVDGLLKKVYNKFSTHSRIILYSKMTENEMNGLYNNPTNREVKEPPVRQLWLMTRPSITTSLYRYTLCAYNTILRHLRLTAHVMTEEEIHKKNNDKKC